MPYRTKHVKHNPDTGEIAVRTVFPEDGPMASRAWQKATINRGGFFVPTSDVESWDDLYVPPES